MHTFRIGGEVADFLLLSIRGRQFPEATDYWNANWLTCNVDACVGAFHGVFGAVIRNEDLGRFLRQLRPLFENSSGGAMLEAAEWLSLDVVADGRSRVKAHVQLNDNCNALEFSLSLDRSELPAIIAQLEEICGAYPVAGHVAEASAPIVTMTATPRQPDNGQ